MLCFDCRNFTTFIDSDYGNCYTFNHGINVSIIQAQKPGPFFGEFSFTLAVLFTDSDYANSDTYNHDNVSIIHAYLW